MGRGPRRGIVAHVRRKSSLVTMARPNFAPKITPSREPIPKPYYLPHPWTRPTYDAKRHPDPIRRFSTMHWTDRRTYGRTYRPTHRLTDRRRESFITIGRCATRATRPNNTPCLKNCAKLFLRELRQISTNFDNFWQKDGKEAKNMRGALIFHLI